MTDQHTDDLEQEDDGGEADAEVVCNVCGLAPCETLGFCAKCRADEAASKPNGHKAPSLIKSSAEFVADFSPPDYVVDGILQRRFCYSLTGRTGAGKTAILLRVAAHVALCSLLGQREVERGRVLYFAGENPVDVQMRWIALAQQMDFDINAIDVHFIPGTFKISELREQIQKEAKAVGDFALVIVDTSAAYFETDDENSNNQAGAHARLLRGLTSLPGGPCVLVACHPVKNATDDNLVPRGGGAFLAEIDGNLTARKHDDGTVEMHTLGKFRGPDFAPMSFQLRTVTHERLRDTKGRLLPTVIASHLSDVAKEELSTAARSKENQLLAILVDHGEAAQRELATLLGWSMRDGKPYQVMVARMLDVLLADKLIKKEGRGFAVTPAGHKVLGNGGRK
jgi:hypothetical protein